MDRAFLQGHLSDRAGSSPDLAGAARALLEGVLLLEPSGLASVGAVRSLAGGSASWRLGAVPPDECIHLQGLVFDPVSGRVCLSDVVRLER